LHESVCLFFIICSFVDIDECVLRDARLDLRDTYPCSGICKNTIGGYDCQCELGMRGDAKNGTCKIVFPLTAMVVTFGKIIQQTTLYSKIYFWPLSYLLSLILQNQTNLDVSQVSKVVLSIYNFMNNNKYD